MLRKVHRVGLLIVAALQGSVSEVRTQRAGMLQKSLNCGFQALKCRGWILRWRQQRGGRWNGLVDIVLHVAARTEHSKCSRTGRVLEQRGIQLRIALQRIFNALRTVLQRLGP